MVERSDITPEICRQLVRYDPETGKLFWIYRERHWFATGRAFTTWNAKHAGKEAFIQPNDEGYLRGVMLRHTFRAQRIAWAVHHGCWPEGDVDHIDGDVQNNRIDNLRDVPRADNNRNTRLKRTNKSGITGVRLDLNSGRWLAQIRAHGKQIFLGSHATRSEAASARREAERTHGFHQAHGRRKAIG